LLVWILAPVLPGVARAEVPQIELSAGVHRIVAEVASTGASRAEGLMYRRQLGANQGMLFVFPEANRHCMWMRNTYVALSVAFIDDQGAVINVAEMQPQTETNHCAARPARYALEMNAGWFARRGLGPGTRLDGLNRAPAPN
jgi:uncharacterized membrane protein (UPF0127 family)